MKKNKLILVSAAAILLTGIFAGCGSKEENSEISTDSISINDVESQESTTNSDNTSDVSSESTQGSNSSEKEIVVTSLVVVTQPNKTVYTEGERFDPTGLTLEATLDDGTKESVESGFTYDNHSKLTVGESEITISYKGASVKIIVTVSKSYQLTLAAQEKYAFEAEDLKVDDKWIMRQDMINAGKTSYVVNSAGSSGGKSIEAYERGSVLTLPFYANEDSVVKLSTVLSNYNDFNLNDTVEFRIDETLLVSDNPTFGHRNDGDWYNWKTATFNDTAVLKGEHVFTITMKGEHPNLDVFYFDVVQFGKINIEKELSAIYVDKMPTKTTYKEGEKFDPTGLVIKASYNTGETEVISDYAIDIANKELTLEDSNVVVSWNGKSVNLHINVEKLHSVVLNQVGTVKYEAEDLRIDDKWILREDMAQAGHTSFVVNSEGSSGGKSIERYENGSEMSLDFYLEDKATVNLGIVLSYYNEIVLDDEMQVLIDGQVVTSNNPTLGHRHATDYYNWKLANYGNIDLEQGEHILTIKMVKAKPNLDVIEFNVVEYGEEKLPHTVKEISIDASDVKTEYIEGDKFDPEGLKFTIKYNDLTEDIVTEGFIVDVDTPLTPETSKVVVKYNDVDYEIVVKVRAVTHISDASVIKNEGEDFDKTNLTHNGNGYIENTSYASEGKILGNGTTGEVTYNYYLDKDMTLDITANLCKYEAMKVTELFHIYIDGIEVALVDPDFTLGAAPDNKWYNLKLVEYVQTSLKAGFHEIKISIGCNTDYVQFVFDKGNLPHTVKDVTINALPTKLEYKVGEKFDITGLKLNVSYDDLVSEVVTEGFTYDEDLVLEYGMESVTVSYMGKEIQIPINVTKDYSVVLDALGDNKMEAEKIKIDDKWILRQDMANAGLTNFVVNSSNSSGGQSIERYDVGTVISVDFKAEEDAKIHLTAVLSNYEDINLNESVIFKIDGEVILSNNPTFGHRHATDWYNWVTADFGVIDIAKGEHLLTIEMKTQHPNLDVINFHTMKLGSLEEPHTVSGLLVSTNPAKTQYIEGEKFDPTGLKLSVVYADSTSEVVSEGFTYDTETTLSSSTNFVTVTYQGTTVQVPINVIPVTHIVGGEVLREEAENFDKTNLTHNGNGYIENTGYASAGQILGNGTTGYVNYYYYLEGDMNLDIQVKVGKYEAYKLKDIFHIYIDGVEIQLTDPDFTLGGTADNPWYNLLKTTYVTQNLEKGLHNIKIEIGCNTDYVQFTFTQVEVTE